MKATLIVFACLVASALSQRWGFDHNCPRYSGRIFRKRGPDATSLDSTIQSYRNALGQPNNGNSPGPLRSGHRSINWDADIVPFDMPFDFFKVNVTRGAEFHSSCNKFAVSNPPSDSGIVDNRFSSFNSRFPALFSTFSPNRLFTPVNSNDVLALFSVPARGDQRASVSGFGAIFTNVRRPDVTKISYFDENNCLIITVPVLSRRAGGLSFAGIIVDRKDGRAVRSAVASARITTGTQDIGSGRRVNRVVVIDDLIYGEPQRI